jgi:excinuclease ABC subunit C
MTPPTTPASFNFAQELKQLPAQPGVYRLFNAAGELIYIGKAKVLKNRVRSYFQSNAQHTSKVRAMVAQVAHFNYIVTATEVEALILEDTLIKQHKPRYNILLRDDRRFPWIGLTDEVYPRLFIARSPKRLGPASTAKGKPKRQARFFGPYPNSGDAFTLINLLKKHFPLRKRPKPLFKDRPCLNHTLGLCLAPCQQLVTPEAYEALVQEVIWVLKGNTQALQTHLQQAMQQASAALHFERAALLRDRLKAVELLSQSQAVVSDDLTRHQDVVAVAADANVASAVVLCIRFGRLVASKPFTLPLALGTEGPSEVLSSFVRQYYRGLEADELPDEVLLHEALEDEALLGDWLSSQRGKVVRVFHPQKGGKKELLKLAQANAESGLAQAQLYEAQRQRLDPTKALLHLQEALGLPRLPRRMECYDISHFQGAETVASMVVFVDGVSVPSEYRHFKVHCAEGKPDDFASMREVLGRRMGHLSDWGEPDLLVIDGGKGQLSAAQDALRAAGRLDLPMVSLAKRFEEVFRPHTPVPVILPRESPALFVLQQLRDEAHRFAITHHRARRAKRTYAGSAVEKKKR